MTYLWEKAMGWERIGKKLAGLNAKYFPCDEGWETSYLKHLIMREFPHFKEYNVEKTIQEVCSRLPSPRIRNEILRDLENQLGR